MSRAIAAAEAKSSCTVLQAVFSVGGIFGCLPFPFSSGQNQSRIPPAVFRMRNKRFIKSNISGSLNMYFRISLSDIAIFERGELEKIGASADVIAVDFTDKSPYNTYQQIPIEWDEQ